MARGVNRGARDPSEEWTDACRHRTYSDESNTDEGARKWNVVHNTMQREDGKTTISIRKDEKGGLAIVRRAS